MVKLTDYGTLQAYVDATLATDGAQNKYGEEGQMQTPRKTPQEGQMQTPQTPQKMQQTRKKGQ